RRSGCFWPWPIAIGMRGWRTCHWRTSIWAGASARSCLAAACIPPTRSLCRETSMSTWLDHWDRRYTDRVQLLVEMLPVLAHEPRFALKGGTAINLFEHDLPRLSVDIDLAWLPVHDYAEDAQLIAEALERLADVLRARPLQLQVQTSAS